MLSEAEFACGGNELEMLSLGFASGVFFMVIWKALLNRVTENWKKEKRN